MKTCAASSTLSISGLSARWRACMYPCNILLQAAVLHSCSLLQVSLSSSQIPALAAATQLTKTQQLELATDLGDLGCDWLLPLTAAAGGAGSCLKRLELDGYCSRFTTATMVGLPGGMSCTMSVPRWHQPLQQFDDLRDLIVCPDEPHQDKVARGNC